MRPASGPVADKEAPTMLETEIRELAFAIGTMAGAMLLSTLMSLAKCAGLW